MSPDEAGVKGAFLARAEAPLDVDEVDLKKVLRQLFRRRGVILSTVFLGTLITAITVFQLTPRYTAAANILVGTPKAKVVDIEEVLSGLGTDSELVQSEIQVIQSRELARKVVRTLGLSQNPEFNSKLRPPSFLSLLNPIDRLPESWRNALLGAAEEGPSSPEEERAQDESRTINAFLESLKVRAEGRSRVIRVQITSESAKLAAMMANTLSELYLNEQLEAKFEATKRATSWLNERVQELREQVEASERAVEEYRKEAGLIKDKGSTVTGQQLSEINTQLILARTESAEASARLRQVESLRKSNKGVESAAEVLGSPLIQRLREQEAEVQRRAAELATEYGARHPKMINVKAEIRDLQGKIGSEVQKIVAGLRNELSVARARESTLKGSLDKLKDEAGTQNTKQVPLRALEREAEANQALFKTFLDRLKETGEQDTIQQADARIISHADVPVSPSFPNKKLLLGAGFVVSVMLGLALVFLIEQLDAGFRSSDQIESMLGLRTLSLVPLLTGLKRRGAPPEKYVLGRPASAFSESLRTLHTGFLLSDVDALPKSMLLTSSMPGEGKSTTAVCLARLMALSGKKVLLMDADLRRRRANRMLGLAESPGLVELLSNDGATVSEIIQQDLDTGLHFLAAGSEAPSPPDLFGSAKMKALMQRLQQHYDLIIIDSPPVLIVSDARVLGRLVDQTVYIVRWAETRRDLVVTGVKQLLDSGVKISGVVLAAVNVRKHSAYDYGDSGYYYGKASSYYTN